MVKLSIHFLMKTIITYIALVLFFVQCTQDEKRQKKEITLFERLNANQTNVNFKNQLKPTEDFNMYLFRNFYNGGGVAAGDVSGDGLPDLFFTGNMTSNRLYVNRGNLSFEDVTDAAGLNTEGYWSTGASMADVNGDGWLDIYVTLSGKPEGEKRYNRLYINDGDSTQISFTESALNYDLEDDGLSTHGVFFDYNKDGRLDLYLISNSFHEVSGFEGVTGSDRKIPDPKGASKLYRNDGDSFTDVTEEAGIYSSVLGFGMSASVSDLNRDGWPDLYVANDFFERDYLYINNGDGTFTESLEDRIRSMSFSSMGSDIGDINNDGWPDIYVTDMLPNDEFRLKSKMTIETWEEYQDHVNRGFHHKFTRNTLQLNRGDGNFSEIGRYADVYATDWSWSTLIADFDNSGMNDIFVANGIYKDLLDQDYIERMSNPRLMGQLIRSGEKNVIMNMMDQMSSTPLSNYAFRNENGLTFSNHADEWGLDEPGFSTGAAWADLDRDGDLDLITNDVNDTARIYRNRAEEIYPNRNWLQVNLDGKRPNHFGIGAQVDAWAGGERFFREHFLQRGFQSSVDPGIHIGLGSHSKVDSLFVHWPDGSTSRLTDINLPSNITISQNSVDNKSFPHPSPVIVEGDIRNIPGRNELPLLNETGIDEISQWTHQDFGFNDFTRDRLLMHMRSTESPALCTGDVNGDLLDDIYIGGAREQAGILWIQNRKGEFVSHQSDLFSADAISQDTDCTFFDATGNGSDDLYVVSGGNSFSSTSSALADRFYLNDGDGNFTKSSQILPTTRRYDAGSVAAPHDFNGDGNMDLFVGTRLQPFAIGMPVNGYLLQGDGEGNFTDVTDEWAPSLIGMGMITDAIWEDISGDSQKELVVTGEWMPVQVFKNTGNRLVEITEELGLSDSYGWWNALEAGDINGDGRMDLVAANYGQNSMIRATNKYPVKMWVGDLSGNGLIDQILATSEDGVYYPLARRQEMVEAIPSIGEQFPDHASYAGKSIEDLFTNEQLNHALSLRANYLASSLIWNRGERMEIEELPPRAQLSPMYDVEIADLDGVTGPEIMMGGNLYNVKPLIGPYDASRGVILSYVNGKMKSWPPKYSGLNITGEIRSVESVKIGDAHFILIARHGDRPVILRANIQ